MDSIYAFADFIIGFFSSCKLFNYSGDSSQIRLVAHSSKQRSQLFLQLHLSKFMEASDFLTNYNQSQFHLLCSQGFLNRKVFRPDRNVEKIDIYRQTIINEPVPLRKHWQDSVCFKESVNRYIQTSQWTRFNTSSHNPLQLSSKSDFVKCATLQGAPWGVTLLPIL